MSKPRDQGNAYYLAVGGMASVKTRSSKKLNYGQTVRIKNINGSTVTVTPDNDTNPSGWAVLDARDLHNNDMSY